MNKNAVSILQEYFQGKNQPLPLYAEGPRVEGNLFTCKVKAGDIESTGKGSTKKEAKIACAKQALESLLEAGCDVTNSPNSSPPATPPDASIENHVSWLNEHASKKGVCYPVYMPAIGNLTAEFGYTCKFLGLEGMGYGRTKKIAKQNAAGKVKEQLKGEPDRNLEPYRSPREALVFDCDQQKIIKLWEQLSLNNDDVEKDVVDAFQNTIERKPDPSHTPPVNIATLEELLRKMNSTHYKYNIRAIDVNTADNQLTMMLSIIGSKKTILATGRTEREAKMNVLEKTLGLVENGCSLDIDTM